jgi:hypothetical protein
MLQLFKAVVLATARGIVTVSVVSASAGGIKTICNGSSVTLTGSGGVKL